MNGLPCPQCKQPTIRRVAGEWCPRCRGFVDEVKIYAHENAPPVRIVRYPR